jgi:peroxiredoxin
MALQVGDKAPDFKLYSTDKKQVSLADFAGKTLVIHFFPQAFTGVCTQQMCTMRDNLSYYNDLNAEIVGISVDSIFTLAKFKETEGINFTLLSDFNKEVSPAYGAFFDEFILGMKGVSRRAAFVVDGTGIIRYAEVLESAGNLPDFDAMKAVVSAI